MNLISMLSSIFSGGSGAGGAGPMPFLADADPFQASGLPLNSGMMNGGSSVDIAPAIPLPRARPLMDAPLPQARPAIDTSGPGAPLSLAPPFPGAPGAPLSLTPPVSQPGGLDLSARAKPAAGPDNLMGALRGLFAPEQPTSSGNPLARLFAGGPARAATPTTGSADNSPLKTIASILRDAAVGASGVDSSAPGLKAFTQGYAGGALAGERRQAEGAKRQESLLDRMMQEDDRQFDRRLKTAQEQRQATSARYSNLKSVADVLKAIDPQLDTKDKIAVERLVRDHGKQLEGQGKTADEIVQGMDNYRKDVEQRLKAGKPRVGPTAPAPAAPASPSPRPAAPTSSAPPPMPKVGQVMSGYRFKGGNPADQNNWEIVQQ